jgi:outer membrane autotransporter protein
MACESASPDGFVLHLQREGVLSKRAAFATSISHLALIALVSAGASSLAPPARAANFDVNSASDLTNAINSASNGDTITFTSNITLGSNLPALTKNVTIDGNGKTLSGQGSFRGFIVGDPFNTSVKPTVAINNLSIIHTLAMGGRGALGGFDSGAGGGGAGLGGGLLILAGANVTATNVSFQQNRAQGGDGGEALPVIATGGGGGGGWSTDGKSGHFGYGGHGGLPGGGDGGNDRSGDLAQPGGFGGGGGGQGSQRNLPGGAGGFGGGGGGAASGPSDVFNAAMIVSMRPRGGVGGFGGGNGGPLPDYATGGGYTVVAGSGGGGAGMGGAVFVGLGGSLTLAGAMSISGSVAAGGAGGAEQLIGQSPTGSNGMGFGAGLFLQGNGSLALAPGAGQTQTISDAIADQTGVGGTGRDAGSWQLVKNGAGTTIFTGDNAYSGGSVVNAGVLQGSATSLPGRILNNASLVFDQAVDGTHTGDISGSGSLTKTGVGFLTQDGAATYSGATIVNKGVLLLTSPLTASSGVTLNGGELGGTLSMSLAQNVVIGPLPGSGFYSAAGANLSFSGVVSGGQLSKSGAGDVTLTGANGFQGASITGGVLRFNTDANLGKTGVIILNGGSVGSTGDSPVALAIGRPLSLMGAGGVDVANAGLTWSGPISGNGQFIKSGSGDLTLTGPNSYSGGTKVLAGSLSIGSDAALGQAGGGVNLAGGALHATGTFATSRPFTVAAAGASSSLNVDGAQTLTLNGPITGGALVKDGAGTLALGVVQNGYSNTFVNAGTLVGNSFSIRGNLAFASGSGSPRSAVFDQSSMRGGQFPAFSGNITGDGSLELRSGTLILSGKNSYTGGSTVLGSGRLVGNTSSLQGAIANDGLVSFSQDVNGTYAGILTGAGELEKVGSGSLSLTGNVLDRFTDVLGGELIVNGRVDSRTVNVDTATLTVNRTMTSDTVSINAGGVLGVSGSLTSPLVTINPGGELLGRGNIIGDVDDRGGEIAPGNSIGTLHIFGPLEMEPHSGYQVQINGASSDEIEVSEKATIESSTFEIERDNTAASPVVPGKTYTILTTGGGLTVEEPTVAIADFPFINFALTEDAFNGYLTTSRSAERFAELASTPNEAAVANALDTTATSSPVWQQVVGASTADARAAFASLSNASIHASAAGVLSEQSHFLRDAVLDRLRQDFPSGPAADPDSVLTYGAGAPAALPTKKGPAVVAPTGPVYAVWAQGLGSWGSLSGNNNVARTNDSIGGVISGIDATFNRMFRLGFAGGYSQSNFNSVNIPASGSADSYHFAVYGGWEEGPWALRGGGSVSWNDLNTSRQITAVALGGQQTSSYADKTWQGFVEGARSFAFGAAALEPFANLAYVHVGGDVGESGLAAMSGSTSFDTTYTTLGAHGSYILPAGLTAQATLGWRYAFGDVTPMSTLGFQSGGAAFALAGSPIARNALITELGVNYAIGPSATIGIAYSGQYSGGSNENSGKANLTVRF